MTDDELISILVDTDAGLAPTEGYAPAIEHVRALIRENARLRTALVIGNKMMGSMNGPAAPPYERHWYEFELVLAALVNDGLLDVSEEGT